MNTTVFEYLLVIAREKNISRAADSLYMTQPSLSRHIRKIEEELGAKLFFRQHNELQLTDAGRIFMNNAQAILHIEKQTMNILDNMRNEQKDKIRMVIGQKERTFFVRNILPAFYELYPNYTVIITEGNADAAIEYLRNGMADIGVLATRTPRISELDCTTLRNDELMLTLPKHSTAAENIQTHGLSFESMKDDYFILNKDDNEYRQMEQEIFSLNRFYPSFLCEVSRFRTALHMVKSNVGNAFLPLSLITLSGKDVHSFSMVPPYTFSLVAAYQNEKQWQTPIMDLIRLLKKTFCDADSYFNDAILND